MATEMADIEGPSVFTLVEAGDLEQLDQHLAEDEGRQVTLSCFNSEGRTPLELAAMLGKGEVARLLVNKGADVNGANKSGYTALHHCVAWGHLDCSKTLVYLGADPLLKTRHQETVIELGTRYKRTDCVNFLDCVVARRGLQTLIQSAREILGDSERISGKWVKDDRQKVTSLCNEKMAWLEHNQDAPLPNIQEQVANFEQRFEPHLAKLAPQDS